MSQIVTCRSAKLRNLFRKCGAVLTIVLVLGLHSSALGQSCGHYVQTKYEREMMHLRHSGSQLEHSLTETSAQPPSWSVRKRFGQEKVAKSNRSVPDQEALPSRNSLPCDGPGCRQQSSPPSPACKCPVPKHKDQVQAILVVCNRSSNSIFQYVGEDRIKRPASHMAGLFRPPQ